MNLTMQTEPLRRTTTAPALSRRALTLRTLAFAAVAVAALTCAKWYPYWHQLATWGIIGVVLLAIVGTLFVSPTAAEIPIVQRAGLAAGVGLGGAGALLVTLPAISLPSVLTVTRAFPARVIAGMAASVAVPGLLAAGILVPLG